MCQENDRISNLLGKEMAARRNCITCVTNQRAKMEKKDEENDVVEVI